MVAEVLDKVLPRYKHLDVASVDLVQHEADLARIVRALAEGERTDSDSFANNSEAPPFS